MKTRLFLLLFILSNTIYSQNNTKVIPIVQYNPMNYLGTIRASFYFPENYLKIEKNEEEISRSMSYETIKKDVSRRGILQSEIFDNIFLNQDSIFIFHFHEYDKYDFKYYGILKDGNIRLYSSDNKKGLSLPELLENEFGSLDRFKELLSISLKNLLDYGKNSGLYPMDEESASSFLKEDYHVYELYAPNDKDRVIEMFIGFLKKHVATTDFQVNKIRIELQKGNPPLPKVHQSAPYYNPNHEIMILNENYSFILAFYLSGEQYEEVLRHINIQNEVRRRYVLYLSDKNPQIHYRGQDRIYLSDEEEEKKIAKLFFEKYGK